MGAEISNELSSIRAVVTGGSSGLGLATVEYILAHGGKTAILDVDAVRGQEVADRLGAVFCQTDVSCEKAVDSAIARAVDTFGGINLAVNCAGLAPSRRVLARDGLMATSDFSRLVDINLVGTFCVVRAAVNAMQHNNPGAEQQRGVIVNTASIAAFDGQIGQAAYSASKAGIVGMTLPLAREFSRIGVRVVTIAPGLFRTPLFDKLPPKAVEELEANTPFPKRLGQPKEFAALVAQIYQNPMLNGETIRLDGALRM